jgi:hypothetical protein
VTGFVGAALVATSRAIAAESMVDKNGVGEGRVYLLRAIRSYAVVISCNDSSNFV